MNIVKIFLPKLGESTTEATLVQWHKKVGDSVALDENLATIGTDKVDSDLPSEFEGVLIEILVKEGETVKVGEPIVVIETQKIKDVRHKTQGGVEVLSNEKGNPIPNNQQPPTNNQQPATNNQQPTTNYQQPTTSNQKPATNNKLPKTNDKKFLSPVVRKIVLEEGVSLEELKQIKGTGNNQRVRKIDVINYLDSKRNPNKKKKLPVEFNDKIEPLTRIRSVTAKHLSESYQNIPHVTTFSQADVTNLVPFRDTHKQLFLDKHQVKITYTHLMFYLLIENLRRFPTLNAWFNEDELIVKGNINLGFATATADGNLLVPNVPKAETLSFIDLVKTIRSTSELAKQGKLSAESYKNTTFTVSNTGIFGSLMGTPIISQPQVAVLALGEISATPSVVLENEKEVIQIRKKMYLSLSYDHRVIDGALASKFLQSYRNLLERFDYEGLI